MTVPETAEPWRKLDRRTIYVSALALAGVAIGAGVPTGIGIASGSSPWVALAWVLPGAALLIVVGTVADYLRWLKTRYRIGPERAELHTGVLLVKRRSLARERIRNVDLTANPLLRVFGLVTVKIGTGEQSQGGESTLVLNPVTKHEADRLRRELLDRASTVDARPGVDGTLARLDPAWIRYAPVSFVAPALGLAAGGAVMQVSDWIGFQDGFVRWMISLFAGFPLVAAILVLAAILLVVGLIGSLVLFVEMWWNYHLEREPGGTLRVRRGLLTTRSISLEERRLRGVEVVEPLGTRLAGAARVDAVATGMVQRKEDDKTDNKTLLPAAPKALADQIAAVVLREERSPTEAARLTPHPIAARGRRLRWAIGTVVVLCAVLAGLGLLLTDVLLHLAWIAAVVGLPIAVVLAFDAYKALGHGISGDYLVARAGTVRRATVALQRDGVIGWTVKQSIFQRRAGLITLTATTAAGSGGYDVLDAGEGEGLAFADEAVPDLLGPFLERA
ncbi:PH domain-containing protein [Amycolatopsis magusensis]|uniref:PH domain-containing protein n=1 Tax=Amycolatopsis magusensis TaxID=882444 RepID=UPI0024A89AC3|nr:PH domain-containing protein [Amycolatopsis magusensis]MDI5981342.1 PH domain-containing protein [Amycolatopsis magusensis]